MVEVIIFFQLRCSCFAIFIALVLIVQHSDFFFPPCRLYSLVGCCKMLNVVPCQRSGRPPKTQEQSHQYLGVCVYFDKAVKDGIASSELCATSFTHRKQSGVFRVIFNRNMHFM